MSGYVYTPNKMDVDCAAGGQLVYTYWRDSEVSNPNQRRGAGVFILSSSMQAR